MAGNYDAWLQRQAEKRDIAELRVLGTCLAYPDQVDLIVATLEPGLFRRDAHRVLADAIWTLARDGKPVGMDTVTDFLLGNGRLDEVGGPVAVYDVYARGEADVTAVEDLLAIERRARLWTACRDGMVAATNPAAEPVDVAADVMAAMVHATDGTGDQAGVLLTVDELVALEPPPWVVNDVIPAGLTVLYGNAKTGKSYIALSIAWAYATGQRWHRRRCRTTPGRVLYLSGEGLADLSLRTRALIESTGTKADTLRFDTRPLALSRERDAAQLRLRVEQQQAELVVVDTWARYSGLRDENDAAQASRAVAALEQLTARGVSVLVVHHANTEGHLRGSTALGGAVESSIRVVKGEGADNRHVDMLPDMTRRGPGFSPIRLKFATVGPDAVLVEPWTKTDKHGALLVPDPQQTLV